MSNRIISLNIADTYISAIGGSIGATGSGNATTLRMTFDEHWDGTTKTVYFKDANGANPVSVTLGLNMLVEGTTATYDVPVPSEPLAVPGNAKMTVKGVILNGTTVEKAITTGANVFIVLDSALPSTSSNAGTITASDKDQLQAEIDTLESLFTVKANEASASAASAASSATAAANSATAAANSAKSIGDAETNASTSATNADTSATNASNSASAASLSKTAAATSETNAASSATAAAASASAATTSETNAANSAAAAAASAQTTGGVTPTDVANAIATHNTNLLHKQAQDIVQTGALANAEGNTTKAIGSSSHAEGFETIATNLAAHAEGRRTNASGDSAHAEGQYTTAFGGCSHSEGNMNVTGNACYYDVVTIIDSNHYTLNNVTQLQINKTIDYGTVENTAFIRAGTCKITAINSNTITLESAITTTPTRFRKFIESSGYAAHAEGQLNAASGNSAHAEGFINEASGDYSHAEGERTTASGFHAHSEGWLTKATGAASHTEGYGTTTQFGENAAGDDSELAAGYAGHAEGYCTQATGSCAHSEGSSTGAFGSCSHAEGKRTVCYGNASHVEGYNSEVARSYTDTPYTIIAKDTTTGFLTLSSVTGLTVGSIVSCGYNSNGDSGYVDLAITSITNNNITLKNFEYDLKTYAIITSIALRVYGNAAAYAHAQNIYTVAQGLGQTVIGCGNIPQGNIDSFAPADYVFIIGNATYANDVLGERSNALTVTWGGDLWIAGTYHAADGSAGATGSFTSQDGKTVTVKNGIITSIA